MAKKLGTSIADELHDFVRANPFRPFDIKTADGDTFHVFHPDFIMIAPSGDTATQYDRDDHLRFINLEMVVSIEPTRPKKGSLGSPGKR